MEDNGLSFVILSFMFCLNDFINVFLILVLVILLCIFVIFISFFNISKYIVFIHFYFSLSDFIASS